MNFPVVTLDQLRPILVGFRKSRRLTQTALADKLGITQQSYAQLEANPASASVERLFRLLRVLGVELVLADVAGEQPAATAAASPYASASTASATMAVQEPQTKPTAPKPTLSRKREAW